MTLLERDGVLDHLADLLSAAREGKGRAVLVRGEAGIGKTSVVRAFANAHADEAHVLWGGCDDLVTARPLGPIWDMALEEPDLAAALRGLDRHELFTVVLELISRALRPTIVVIEDIHWADEATLDLIKYLGRRIDRTHGLLVMTYRDGEVPGDLPLRQALGDVAASALERIALDPLSPAAVAEMAGERDRTPEALWQITGGNPFFLTELLGAGGDAVPVSVRESVLARVSRLGPEARSMVDVVAVVPSRAELELLGAVLGPLGPALEEAEAADVLVVSGGAVSFRHELARRSVEASLTETRRREVNLQVLRAMEELGFDAARVAHHARVGGDIDALIRLAPLAARHAADMESHNEAVAHLRAIEPHLDRLEEEVCADHYDLWAWEEYLINELSRAEEIIEIGIGKRRRLGDAAKLGNTLLIGSRIAWVHNRRSSAVELANEAADVLGPVGGEDLAFAYSTISQLAMLASDEPLTLEYAEKALAAAGEGESRARAHALNNIGAVKMGTRYPQGMEESEAGFAMSADLGYSHEQIRAAVNIGWSALYARDVETAEQWVATAHELALDREIPSFEAYAVAATGLLAEMRGRWADAEANAVFVLENLGELATARMVANTLLGRLRARTGHPQAKGHLLAGWELALQVGEIQRTSPAGVALAEYVWIGGTLDQRVFPRLRDVLSQSIALEPRWRGGELAFWLWMIGELEEVPDEVADPYHLAAEGEWEKAAGFWEERGIPYDRAVALSHGSVDAKIEALSIFDDLGAVPLAARLRSELTEAGVSGVPRGPIRATRENPFGLTPRQMDVLRLVAEGMTNAEIADRLFVSNRTVDHHVSAVLGKLGAGSRSEAASMAEAAALLDG